MCAIDQWHVSAHYQATIASSEREPEAISTTRELAFEARLRRSGHLQLQARAFCHALWHDCKVPPAIVYGLHLLA